MLTGARISAQRKRIGSRKIEKIVDRCLQEEPGRRWQSAIELEHELSAVAGGTALWKVAAAVSVAVLAVSAGAYFYFHRAPKLTDKDTIVLADFDNKTRDPVFDDTLRQGLSFELQQSPFLSLISDQRVQQTLALMGQPKGARLTPEIAQQVCERTACAAILEGSIANLGSEYVLELRAKDGITEKASGSRCRSRRQGEKTSSTRSAGSRASSEPGWANRWRPFEATQCRLPLQTTPSLEALKAYSAGNKVQTVPAARGHTFFRRAALGNRSSICDSAGHVAGLCWLSRRSHRLSAVGSERYESLAIARSRQRLRKIFYRFCV